MNNLHPEQRRILKSMTPEMKLQLAMRLHRSARELKAAVLRSRHPSWSQRQIEAAVRETFLYART
jgi:hypothetical protein